MDLLAKCKVCQFFTDLFLMYCSDLQWSEYYDTHCTKSCSRLIIFSGKKIILIKVCFIFC